MNSISPGKPFFCKNTPDSKQQKNVEIIHWNISRSNQGHSFDSFGKHQNSFLETEIYFDIPVM